MIRPQGQTSMLEFLSPSQTDTAGPSNVQEAQIQEEMGPDRGPEGERSLEMSTLDSSSRPATEIVLQLHASPSTTPRSGLAPIISTILGVAATPSPAPTGVELFG